jgi:hypothetical protein
MKAPCRNLVVGQASSQASSIITVFPDRLEYNFHHNKTGRIQMCMWFRDICEAMLEGLLLTFHVRKALRHFSSEYDPGRATDRLALEFFSLDNATEFRRVASAIFTSVQKPVWPKLM